jgi:UDP-N-acetylmuramate dehydrogenase
VVKSDMPVKGKLLLNEPMARYTSLQVGGKADLFFVPEDLEDLKRGLSYALEKKMPWFILGNGSNILVSDDGIEGMVIHLSSLAFRKLHFEKNVACVGAGMKAGTFLHEVMKKGLGGVEFLGAIPGSMGGIFYMNAGTYLGEISNALQEVSFLDESLNVQTLPKEALNFRYRKSLFQEKKWVILEGKIELSPREKDETILKLQEILDRRRKTQPLGMPSAGSAFKNPPNQSAWRLIDNAGLRNFSIGNAAVSETHANFVINKGGATASEIFLLMRTIQEKVKERFGILLEPEVLLVGRWKEDFLK